jgi:hypothetical protein
MHTSQSIEKHQTLVSMLPSALPIIQVMAGFQQARLPTFVCIDVNKLSFVSSLKIKLVVYIARQSSKFYIFLISEFFLATLLCG